jgi:hypothetical protein
MQYNYVVRCVWQYIALFPFYSVTISCVLPLYVPVILQYTDSLCYFFGVVTVHTRFSYAHTTVIIHTSIHIFRW